MITVYLLLGCAVLAFGACCFVAGQIWEVKRQMREDYNERDAWADRYQQEHKGAA